ncbi:MAG: hypothetical protein V7640_1752 [Betaproteobacteria bacterium]|jgi:hypothetical protein
MTLDDELAWFYKRNGFGETLGTRRTVSVYTPRFVTDILLGYTMFEAVKPKKRADLY